MIDVGANTWDILHTLDWRMVQKLFQNNWQDCSYVFHKAVSLEPITVKMKPTKVKVKISNGNIFYGIYGVNYMDDATLDQFLTPQSITFIWI
jgi:hypothetical protein